MKLNNLLLILMCLLVIVSSSCSKAAQLSADNKSQTPEVKETTKAETNRLDNLNLESQFPVVKEQITMTLMGARSATQGEWEDLKFFKVLQERSNIKLEFITVPAENWEERKNLAFASDNLPDIFYGCILSTNDVLTYGPQGYLIPLEELIDEYTINLKAILEKDRNIAKDITTPDGHIYALPFINDMPRDLTEKLWFNKKWCDILGIEVPNTTEEFYNVLKAFKEGDPNGNGEADEIPLSLKNLDDPTDLRIMMSYWGMTVDRDTYIFREDDTLGFAPIQPEFKEFLLFMKRLYQEGLMDSESFTQKNEQLKAKGKETPMKLGAFVNAGAFLVVPEENNEDYIALPPLMTKDGNREWIKYNPVFPGAFAITKNCEMPEAAIRMVDWVYSSEGALVQMRGLENEDYEYINEEKTLCKLIIPEGFNNFEEYRAKMLTPDSGSRTPGIGGYTLPAVYNPLNDYINEQVEENLIPYWKTPLPLLYFSSEDQKKIASIGTDIKTYVVQSMAQFITGERDVEAEWDSYIADLEKMGVHEYVKIHQEAYDTWNKN